MKNSVVGAFSFLRIDFYNGRSRYICWNCDNFYAVFAACALLDRDSVSDTIKHHIELYLSQLGIHLDDLPETMAEVGDNEFRRARGQTSSLLLLPSNTSADCSMIVGAGG